jgi:hypothetical protein
VLILFFFLWCGRVVCQDPVDPYFVARSSPYVPFVVGRGAGSLARPLVWSGAGPAPAWAAGPASARAQQLHVTAERGVLDPALLRTVAFDIPRCVGRCWRGATDEP